MVDKSLPIWRNITREAPKRVSAPAEGESESTTDKYEEDGGDKTFSGMFCFTNFQAEDKIVEKKVADKLDLDEESIMKTFIYDNEDLKKDRIENRIMYWTTKNTYVKTQKQTKESVKCKLEPEQGEFFNINISELSNTVIINVVTSTEDKSENKQNGFFKVEVEQPLMEQLQAFTQSGSPLIYKSKVIEKEATAHSLGIMTNQVVQLCSSVSKTKIPTVIWYRFKNCEMEDEVSASQTNPDALRFKAKVDIMFCGLVWTRNQGGKDFKLRCQYRLSLDEGNNEFGPVSEELHLDSTESVIDARKDMHTWDFQDYGHEALLIPAGQYIDIKVYGGAGDSDTRRFNYIHGGYERNYSNIEGQEFHFTTEYSDWNENSTDTDWGFLPGILYAPV